MTRDNDKPDQIFARPRPTGERFAFDEQVASVFPDMIRRSVPGYELTLTMISVLTAHYARPDTRCYDLGCSLGASTLAMLRSLPRDCRIIAADNSPTMAARCAENLQKQTGDTRADVICADICDLAIENASLVTLNFTLQFIPVDQRPNLLRSIHTGLNSGGALILSEKIAFDDPDAQHLLEDLHHDFKHAMGYSRLEIARKRAALEQVLLPDNLNVHIERLSQAGFGSVYPWFQCFNFISLLAIK